MFRLNPQSYEDLLSLYNEETIYNYYLGHCILDKHFYSVFRQEKTPSMMLKVKGGVIRWYDFGRSKNEVSGSRAINLIMDLHGLTYYEALDKMYEDLEEGKPQEIIVNRKEVFLSKQIKFQESRPQYVDNYFKLYNITPETLDLFNVWYCTQFRFNNKLWHKSNEIDFMAIYMFSIEFHAWQIIRPYAGVTDTNKLIDKKKKFRPNNMEDVIMGFKQLPKHCPVIIIKKAYKEVLVAHECKIPAVCKVGENRILEPFEIDILRSKCDHLIYLGDNDKTGKNMQEQYKRLKIPAYECPGPEKDPSDLSKIRGLEELNKFYYNLLKPYV